MTDDSEESPDWVELDSYPSSLAAEIDAAYLRSEGIPAMTTLPGLTTSAMLWIDRSKREKASWLLKFPPVTENELEFLATGELPKPKEQP